MDSWEKLIDQILLLPQNQQRQALLDVRKNLKIHINEEWNFEFGQESLYEAWSLTDPMQNIYNENRTIIREYLKNKDNWVIVEAGGGNGVLWRDFFQFKQSGTFILIDPNENSHQVVKKNIPSNIHFNSIISNIQDVQIPEADIIICSLILHHIPGYDLKENSRFNIVSPGKLEVVQNILKSIKQRNGICIINESDIYTDVLLPSDDPILFNRLIETYIRRAGKAVAKKIDETNKNQQLKDKLISILIHWSIDQVEKAGSSKIELRDVYELDTILWKKLFIDAGANILSHKLTDDWCLFHQYIIN